MALIKKTFDGNTAAAYASYAFTEVAGIYPITPSSPMAEITDEWSANGLKNVFGQTVKVVELQSEAGAAGTVHGSLAAGALTTTYTASQGLLLMIPNLYKMAGELLPGVLHVSARTVATHALSIFGDHSDVMAARQTGVAMLCSNSVQEVVDLGSIAHLSTIKSRVPFIHFFDGFRTSHEIQKVECLEYDDLAELVDYEAVNEFRRNALNPEHPVTRGTAQNPDIFFQARESSNKFYDELPEVVENYMHKINEKTGRDYQLFNYYGASDAEHIIIAMGSGCEAIEEVVDYLVAKGEKVGLLKVRLFRPFSLKHFLGAVPKSVKKIAVLDRTKEPGSLGEPLYQDICTAYIDEPNKPEIFAGRFGLSSKDFTPAQVVAVYESLKADKPKKHFTVGIVDDVTNLSIPVGEEFNPVEDGTVSCKFWGLGADGTVGANKNSIKIIGDNTDLYSQAYFSYDSKKSGGVTQSHLRFGKNPIRSTYLVKTADFVACHKPSYVDQYDMLSDLREGGTFLLNCNWNIEEIEHHLPAEMLKQIVNKKIKFYTIDATKIASEIGLGNRTNTVLQSAFFKLADIIPYEEAVEHMKKAIHKTYIKKGQSIVDMNCLAVDKGADALVKIEVKPEWANATSKDKVALYPANPAKEMKYVTSILNPVNAQKGDFLPVSTFIGHEDGTVPNGTAAYEKRNIAVMVPKWNKDNCIQCNQCAYVCPHATVRPFLASEEEMKNAPANYTSIKGSKGYEEYEYSIRVDVLDCAGCGACSVQCPAKEKALVMESAESQYGEMENWYFAKSLSTKVNPMKNTTVKGSQFEMPYLEFSGACAGCGETPYAKLVTQLFGDRMYVANATGCSSIWAGSAPATPYTVDENGHGPAWANSLFEDNAEFGFGMYTAVKHIREGLELKAKELVDAGVCVEEAKAWIDSKDDSELTRKVSTSFEEALKGYNSSEHKETVKYLLDNSDQLVKKSQWIVGGDGWAYDIGFGGLDHVIASGENVNILVFDTEVYSNTGGQSSKATPTASVAKFAASGKRIRKKDLGAIAMTYGYVYVAQVGMGANQNQLIKALVEAEAYDGPSIIIAYAPCINHGIKGGLISDKNSAQVVTKKAVESGYWHLFRYNPELTKEGKNPFTLDSKAPTGSFRDFINNESRYTSLKITFPDVAEELFEAAENDAKERYQSYVRMSEAKY
ncbi:MAG: pyruvate:ferredoxin (flavodoxin) oxidoreductase [Lachnospirales bacterium]